MKIPSRTYAAEAETARAVANQSTLLYDLGEDAGQLAPLADHAIEAKMIQLLLSRMEESDAPVEQYERLGLPLPWEATDESILAACITETPRGTATREANGGGSLMGAFATAKGPLPIPESMMKHLRPGVGFGAAGAQAAPSGVGTPRL